MPTLGPRGPPPFPAFPGLCPNPCEIELCVLGLSVLWPSAWESDSVFILVVWGMHLTQWSQHRLGLQEPRGGCAWWRAVRCDPQGPVGE